jgi:hypothetical protein
LLSNVNEGGLISMHAWLRPSVTRRGLIVGTGLLMGMLLFPGGTGRTLAHAADGHPAKIHEGTCDALGRVAFPLTGVGAAVDLQQQPIATPTAVNPHSSYQIMISETTIPVSLATLLSGAHAVMVYDSDEDLQAVACGTIGGAMMGDTLVVGLAEMGVPGHTGMALFRPDGEQTVVTILFGHGLSPVSASGGMADPAMAGMDDMAGMDMTTPAP